MVINLGLVSLAVTRYQLLAVVKDGRLGVDFVGFAWVLAVMVDLMKMASISPGSLVE